MFQAVLELGAGRLGLFFLYRLGLWSGLFRLLTPAKAQEGSHPEWNPQLLSLPLPDRALLKAALVEGGEAVLQAAGQQVLSGMTPLFGAAPVPIRLEPVQPLLHWTEYERRKKDVILESSGDIKLTWEQARLAPVFTLARLYYLYGDEQYAVAFWNLFARFEAANPAYLGLNWVSAQEAALRLIAMAFAWRLLAESPHSTPERTASLGKSIALHAARIPPTLIYARAQNNNHLLSEAAGLYTAAALLPDHPAAPRWRRLGWRWFNHGLRSQIAPDGAYTQHSANYQRLMLQLALWMRMLAQHQGQSFPLESQERLAAATRWLLALLDQQSGCVPNLGPNDGAYILPLTVCPFEDYRPLLQAAAQAFLGERLFGAGVWDEMALWLVGALLSESKKEATLHFQPVLEDLKATPHTLVSPAGDSWVYLRAANFTSRPGHADQLHLDLWWRGLNLALDAGTYLYNAPAPWENALRISQVHNTLTVDGEDQMLSAGKFLYLGWAQAQALSRQDAPEGEWRRLSAQHSGYCHLGLIHRREVTAFASGDWLVEDALLPQRGRSSAQHTASLQWLLPDWAFRVEWSQTEQRWSIWLESPSGRCCVMLSVAAGDEKTARSSELLISRLGKLAFGEGEVRPTWGWRSPTYGVKLPALSLRLTARGAAPLFFNTQFSLPCTSC